MQKLFFLGCVILGACSQQEAPAETRLVAVTQPTNQPGASLVDTGNIEHTPLLVGDVYEPIGCGLPAGDLGEPPPEPYPMPLRPGMDPPKKIAERCAAPVYPEAARLAGRAGAVKLRITVSEAGRVTEVHLLEGPEEFFPAAKKYLTECEFTPAIHEGEKIAVTKLETINFTLR